MINSQLNLTWWNVVNIDKKIKDGTRTNILVDNYWKQAGAELCQAQGKMFLDYNSIGEPAPPRHVQG